MIISYENRSPYLYFLFSGLVASAILVLLYLSLQTTINDRCKENLRQLQQSLVFHKPATSWNYNNSWQPIGPLTLRHQIYSAYFDYRADIFGHVDDGSDSYPYGSVRIFAILPLKIRSALTCHVRQQDFTVAVVPALEAALMHEHHGTQLAAYSIMCPLRTKRDATQVLLPLSVAISYEANSFSRTRPTYVPISYPKHMEAMTKKSRPEIAVCVEPLQLEDTNALRIVEFVELYRIQGVSRFYFYRDVVSSETVNVLDYYRGLGVAEILDWSILSLGDAVHETSVTAQFNDCIFRAMVVENYRYAVMVDLDEIIMPMKHSSLAEYLRHCDEGRTSGFVFRNVFFYRQDINDMFSVPQHVRNRLLYTQNKVRRTAEVMPAYLRSKCVVNTRAIVEMHRHQVYRALPGYVETVLHPSVGLLFQYRDKCINCKTALVVDYTALRVQRCHSDVIRPNPTSTTTWNGTKQYKNLIPVAKISR